MDETETEQSPLTRKWGDRATTPEIAIKSETSKAATVGQSVQGG